MIETQYFYQNRLTVTVSESEPDFQKGFEGNYFSAFWRLHPDKSILDSTAVEAGNQAVQVSLGESNVLICVSWFDKVLR